MTVPTFKIPQRLNFICRCCETLCSTFIGKYENGTECSEMLAYKIQTLGNYPEESIQHSEHDSEWCLYRFAARIPFNSVPRPQQALKLAEILNADGTFSYQCVFLSG